MTARNRLLVSIILILAMLVGGTTGFTLIEGWSINDSLYMAIITISTVGFGEVQPLSETGRIVAVLLIVFSLITIGYSATAIFVYLIEGHLVEDIRRRQIARKMEKIKNHYILCGAGKFGREVASEFLRSSVNLVVIDKEPELCSLSEQKGILFVKGDAQHDQALIEAKINTAKGLISALPKDDANVFVVLTARQLNKSLKIITQATDFQSIDKMMLAGANKVISPYRSAGRNMANSLLRPSVRDFLDEALDQSKTNLQLEEIHLSENSSLIGKTLNESRLAENTGAIILAIQEIGKKRIDSSQGEKLAHTTLIKNHIIIALGTDNQLTALKSSIK